MIFCVAAVGWGTAQAAEDLTNSTSAMIAQTPRVRERSRGTIPRSSGFELLDEAMRLTKKHYADPVSEREILERTLARIKLGLPPQCVEDAGNVTDCSATLNRVSRNRSTKSPFDAG